MTLSKLQLNQIQQFHDGEINKTRVSDLLERSPHARVYLTALEELALATKVAMDQAWENADTQNAALDWANAAFNATQLLDMKLVDLAPMLERFHDDEVSAMESASVMALMQEREDIADYLETLDVLSGRVKTLDIAKDVNFDGFFDKIAAELDFSNPKVVSLKQKGLDHSFSYEEHAVLIQRFFDGEVNSAERQRVESWIDTENNEVLATLSALEELNQAATIASEHAVEAADFGQLWAGIESSISQESEVAQQVVQLGTFREKKQESLVVKYQQAIFTALAAVLLLGVFGPRLFAPQERVIEKIVIIDGITSEPGTRVRIDAPISQVSAEVEDDEDDSTVIWITDESLDEQDVKDKEPAKEILKKKKETEYNEPI